MATIKFLRDLGCSNGWDVESLEKRLVEMTLLAGFKFTEEKISPNKTQYTCEAAGLTYHTLTNEQDNS